MSHQDFFQKPGETYQGRPVENGKDPEQARFDTVVGPNLRMKDNVIQALAIAGGLVLGLVVAPVIGWFQGSRGQDLLGWTLGGGFAGVVLSLLLSGTIIGVYRTIHAGK